MSALNDSAFLRKPAVLAVSGYGASTLYNRIKAGLFPRPIRIGTQLSAWRALEIVAVNDAIAAGKSDDELRDIVQALEAARKFAAR